MLDDQYPVCRGERRRANPTQIGQPAPHDGSSIDRRRQQFARPIATDHAGDGQRSHDLALTTPHVEHGSIALAKQIRHERRDVFAVGRIGGNLVEPPPRRRIPLGR
jgi:hypothetical protein